MTTQQKNIEIAKMLGWRMGKDERFGKFWFDKNGVRKDCDTFLLFHDDANWQFEAIDWIERQGYVITINQQFIGINAYKEKKSSYWIAIETWNDLEVIITEYFNSRKEAIFEALYQFSQYLKENK